MKSLINQFDVPVISVRANYLKISDCPLTAEETSDYKSVLIDLIGQARSIGADTIIVPLASALAQSVPKIASSIGLCLQMKATLTIPWTLLCRNFLKH